MSEYRWVRLKPYDPRKGFVVKTYVYKGSIYRWDPSTNSSVWYKVPLEEAQELARLHQPVSLPDGREPPPLFDVVTDEEREQIMTAELRLRIQALGITNVTNLEGFTVRLPGEIDRVSGQAKPVQEISAVQAIDRAFGSNLQETQEIASGRRKAIPPAGMPALNTTQPTVEQEARALRAEGEASVAEEEAKPKTKRRGGGRRGRTKRVKVE